MRDANIDVAKGLGILTVVLCHNWILYFNRGELSEIVFSFHMPLFFFISGIFFSSTNSFSTLISKKADSLLKPYLVVTIALGLLYRHTDVMYWLGAFYASGQTIDMTPLWFLAHLFISFILSYFIHRYVLSRMSEAWQKWSVIAVMFIVGAHYIRYFLNSNLGLPELYAFVLAKDKKFLALPFNADITLITSAFLLSGNLLAQYFKAFKVNYRLMFVTALVFISTHYLFNDTIELNDHVYSNTLICTLQAFCGIYLTFAFADLAKKTPILYELLAYLGVASLFIFTFHFIPQHYITGVLQYRFPNYLFLGAAIGFVASIIFSLAIWELTKRSTWLSFLLLPSNKKNVIQKN